MRAQVQAQLKRLHSPDVFRLEDFKPVGPFGILVQAMVGPAGANGEESFDAVVCTVEWFDSNMADSIMLGRHFIFIRDYNYSKLWQFIANFCESCRGASWREVAQKVSRLGKWEFEDYVP
jgi:hypothetical protein